MKDYSSNITRALRKHYGITQKNFSELIDVRQGTLSKIESDQLSLSATQWIYLCDHFKVDPSALLSGKIEMLKEDSVIKLNSTKRVGTFKIPQRYSFNMGSTVRTVFPILSFIDKKSGPNTSKELLKELGMDSDYFIIQSHPISLMLINDIVRLIIQKGILNQQNIWEIFENNSTSEIHSYVIDQLEKSKKQELAFKKLTSVIPKYYEINANYEFVGDEKCLIKVKNNLHLRDMKFDEEFDFFRENFNMLHFEKLSKHLSFDKRLTSVTTDEGWNIAYSA